MLDNKLPVKHVDITGKIKTQDKQCTVEGCTGTHHSLGYCEIHYRQLRKYGTIKTINTEQIFCIVEGCTRSHHSKGYCESHYNHIKRYSNKPMYSVRKLRECLVEHCSRKHHAKGYCNTHYIRYRKLGKL